MNQKIAALLSAAALCAGMTACASSAPYGSGTPASTPASDASASAPTSAPITVISREDGSGTRGAFIELFGVEQKNDAGEKVDCTTPAAAVNNSTSVMMTTVAGDRYAIGYISLGSLNDTVKALKIDGTAASAANIKNGSYKVARPFNSAVREDVSETAQDVIR